MTNEPRSLAMHEAFRDAAGKFDHFVLAATLAVCAFLAQSIPYGQLGANIPTLHLVNLLTFGASAWFGFRRIESTVSVFRLNALYLDALEKGWEADALLAKHHMKIVIRKTESSYGIRNGFLAAGFISYAAIRVFSAYVT